MARSATASAARSNSPNLTDTPGPHGPGVLILVTGAEKGSHHPTISARSGQIEAASARAQSLEQNVAVFSLEQAPGVALAILGSHSTCVSSLRGEHWEGPKRNGFVSSQTIRVPDGSVTTDGADSGASTG
jgi:hypothetical protein